MSAPVVLAKKNCWSFKISLILATVDRTTELERFLFSLDQQVGAGFELIVVDQNRDDRLVRLFRERKERYSITHVRSEPGLSRSRNIGLHHACGELVCFPDDDCWYPEGLLSKVCALFSEYTSWDGVTGRLIDAEGKPSNGRFGAKGGRVDRLTVWTQAISYTIFLRRRVIEAVGQFDEELGLGSGTPFASGEETDYLIRAVIRGYNIQYVPELRIHHPHSIVSYDEHVIKKARAYGVGMGHVVRRHRYPTWFKAKILLRPLGGALLSLLAIRLRKACYHLYVFIGRSQGLMMGIPK